MKTKRYVIVNSRRFFTFITLVITLLALIVFTIMNLQGAYSSAYTIETEDYWVKQGETLWSIAQEYSPDGYDIRKMIYEIKEINEMETSMIYSGDKIMIPIIADNN